MIGGDGLVMSIAAASIIAKVTRDRLMCALAQDCPGYGFETHKGYAVPEHLRGAGPARARASITAASSRRWSPRGKSIIPQTVERDLFTVETHDRVRGGRESRSARFHSDDLSGRVASAAGALYHTSSGRCGGRRLAGHFGRFMRFTSLIVELIRARPRLVVWLVVLLQAAMWLILPLLLYRSPPGDLATVLAFGREYQVGTDLGPPLAFWLADIAFRAAGNHMFGVYLLAQLCSVVDVLDASISWRAPSSAASRRCSRCC